MASETSGHKMLHQSQWNKPAILGQGRKTKIGFNMIWEILTNFYIYFWGHVVMNHTNHNNTLVFTCLLSYLKIGTL